MSKSIGAGVAAYSDWKTPVCFISSRTMENLDLLFLLMSSIDVEEVGVLSDARPGLEEIYASSF